MWNEVEQEKYKTITRDAIFLDGTKEQIFFNGGPIKMEELSKKLETSSFIIFSSDFCFNSETKGKRERYLSQTITIMGLIAASNIDSQQVGISLRYNGYQDPKNPVNQLLINADDSLALNKITVSMKALSVKLAKDVPLSIYYVESVQPHSNRLAQVLDTLKGMDIRKIRKISRSNRASVSAKIEIFQINDDGTTEVLSAPSVRTSLGGSTGVTLGSNESGYINGTIENDDFRQQDLTNIGIKMSIDPQRIGEYFRLKGIAVLVKLEGKEFSFPMGDIPIYSYSVNKTVIPFSVVLPPNFDYVELPMPPINGKPTRCRLTCRLASE